MKNIETKFRFLNTSILQIIGIILIFLSAAALLWQGNAKSNQAQSAMLAQLYLDGEYRIADGPWQKIVKGEHISSTKGDVTLRGKFHLLSQDGEYIGPYSEEEPIAFYTNHINLTIRDGEKEPFVIDTENPLYGDSVCGADWIAYSFSAQNTEPIEIVVKNPHSFGNETAVDELLSNVALWGGIDFEKRILESGISQRNMGILFIIVSIMFLGITMLLTLIHIKSSKTFWALGIVIFFAGVYLIYSAEGILFWSESIVSNTTILGCSMMFYMLFLLISLVHFLKGTKKVGEIAVAVLGAANVLFFVLPMLTDMFFYDTLLYWAGVQMLANIVMMVCIVKEICSSKGKERWLYFGLLLPLVAFGVDIVMIDYGLWKNSIASEYIFIIFFVYAMVTVLGIIPRSINALNKAKELETEKIMLDAQLMESRVSIMMSQIRPHFIYNTLGSIEQLCDLDPPKAGELVHNFAKYLRGNFGELDNPKPILMSQEMEHVRYYISIEKVRFPDMTFAFEMNSGDFNIPALTIQPIVENAIKHGLMKLPKGGTIRVVSYETDTHYCVLVEDDGAGFDTSVLLDERKHIGIRNIRGRLKAMVDGDLEIESTIGVGTKVTVKIPKEEHR